MTWVGQSIYLRKSWDAEPLRNSGLVQRNKYESHSRKERVTVGLELPPKLDGVAKHSQQDEGEITLTRYDDDAIRFIS